MPADLLDLDRLFDAVKTLRSEARKMAKLSEKARSAGLGKPSQKASTALNWQAMAVIKAEATAHAAAVDCGIADRREPEHYATRDLHPSGFHQYRWNPPRPRISEMV